MSDLDRLADDYWDSRLRAAPTWAHLIGEHRYADRFDDVSRRGEEAAADEALSFADRAEAISDEGLDDQQRVTRAMVAWDARARAGVLASRTAELGADPVFGVQASLPVSVPRLSVPDLEVAEAMVGKFEQVAVHLHDLAERHREGVASGRTPAELAVRQTVEQLGSWLTTPINRDPMLDVQDPPTGMDAARWHERLLAVVQKQVRPAFEHYRDVLRDEVAPHARPDERCGLAHLPDGDAVYAEAAAFYTTVDTAPAEIHEVGLRQVALLEEEYRALGPEVVGTSDVPAVLAALRDDPALHHTSGDRVVKDAEAAMDKAWTATDAWFGRLPSAGCEVEATTSGAIASYVAPPRDGSRGGVLLMNVSAPEGWGRFEIETTSYHEGIPGHHLQLGIAVELDGLPELRKRTVVAAYGEGWGLYAERLADEMGLYSSPLDRMGMVSADSVRACRLVVDTGMHAHGWSRQRAVDYMLANAPMRAARVEAEIDRCAVTPGQALSYLMGRLEIQRIRRAVEDRCRDAFDIRAFHDAVLGSGPVPLGLLDRVVSARLP